MGTGELKSAVKTVNTSIGFLLLFILGLLLSLFAVLTQRRQLCLALEGGDPSSISSPYPLQHTAGLITLFGLIYFFQLAVQTNRSAQASDDPQTRHLAWWNLLAGALALMASVIRLWTLEQGQGRALDTLIEDENIELPA